MLLPGRAAEPQVEPVRKIADLPAPARAGFDLPRHRMPLLQEAAHGKVLGTGPRARIGKLNALHAEVVHCVIAERLQLVFLPLAFAVPGVVRQHHAIGGIPPRIFTVTQSGQREGTDVLERKIAVHRLHLGLRTQGTDAVIKLPENRHAHILRRLGEQKGIPFFVSAERVTLITQFARRGSQAVL